MMLSAKAKSYYRMTKPGIIFGNVLTALCGSFLAARTFPLEMGKLVFMSIGLSLVVASGCVLNNYYDRFSDRKMKRTRERPLASGQIGLQSAGWFAWTLLFFGLFVLYGKVHLLAALSAGIGFIVYVFFYTILKYKTSFATELGSIAGAVPPLVGYSAVAGGVDAKALFLFGLIALWQMPHFFAIALYRMEEYASASIPVLPLKKGIYATKVRIALYTGLFLIFSASFFFLGYTGIGYFLASSVLGIYWLKIALEGFFTSDDRIWAKKMFLFSLIVILGLFAGFFCDVWI